MMSRTILGTVVLAVVVILATSESSIAQRRGSTTRGGAVKTPAQFQAALWDYLTKGESRYKKWGAFPGKTTDIYEGESPHGAYLRIYANSAARSNGKNPPAGSIVVKENYGKDKKTLMAVTVMYKSKGYNAKAGDWYWIKYSPDGKTALTPKQKGSKPIAGRFQSCIQCHSDADGDDWLFVND